MRRRVLSMVVMLAMCLSLLPASVLAVDEGVTDITTTGLTIQAAKNGSKELTPSAVYQAGEGTLTWDLETRTITLENATINATSAEALKFATTSETDPEILIVLQGTNHISSSASYGGSHGIYGYGHTLRFRGNGTLTTTGGAAQNGNSAGIYCTKLVVDSGATIYSYGGDSKNSYGVLVQKAIEVGGTLNASGGVGSASGGGLSAPPSSGLYGQYDSGTVVVHRGGLLELGRSGENAFKNYRGIAWGGTGFFLTVEGQLIASGTSGAFGQSPTFQNDVTFMLSSSIEGTNPISNTTLFMAMKYVEVIPRVTKVPQADLAITGLPAGAIRYNDTFPLSTSGGSGGGAVTWSVTAGSAAVDTAGTVKVTGTGDITVKAVKAGGTDYEDAEAVCTFTAEKAVPDVGTVACATSPIHPGTAAVTLTRTDETVPGNLALADNTVFTVGTKEYDWVFTPTDSANYETVTGKISLTVTAGTLESIAVTKAPDKLSYTFGETFDNTGMVVTATYSDGTTRAVLPTFNGALITGQTSVELTYTEGESTKTCLLSGLTVNKKAGGTYSTIVSVRYNDTSRQTVDLRDFLPADCGTVSDVAAAATSVLIASTAGDKDAKSAFFTLASGLDSGEQAATLTVTVKTQNYSDITVTITVKTTAKTPLTIEGVTAQGGTYNGRAHTGYAGTPRAEGYTGSFTATYSDGSAPVNAGEYSVTIAVPDDNDSYTGSVTLHFTVSKASITITADDKSITVGGAKPELTATITGLAEGETLKTAPVLVCDADLSKAGTYPITVSGALVPDGGNYEETITYRPGVLTVRSSGSSSGGSSGGSYGGSSSSSSTTTKNPDGSTTVKQENKTTGAVTETTRYPDGSQIVTETRKDGSQVTTVDTADGSRSTTTAGAGTVSKTTVHVSNAAIRSAEMASKPVPLPMPALTAGEDADDAPQVTVTTGRAGSLRVEIPVAAAAPGTVAVLIRPNGSQEIIKASIATENGLSVPLADGAVVRIVDNSSDFADTRRHWAADAVDFVSARELFSGTAEGTFSPSGSMTRGMLATVLARYDGVEAQGASAYEAGLRWATEKGITDGSSPREQITREQLAAMLYRYAGSPVPPDLALTFTDTDQISGYAEDAVRWAVDNGLINGMGDGTLAPRGIATRAQAAAILMRFCQYMAEQ